MRSFAQHSIAIYKPFSDITRASLKHALAESNKMLSVDSIETLMKAYDSLSTFPDVPPALTKLSNIPGIDAYIFSNGTDDMVSTSVTHSPSLSNYASVFKGLITVQEIELFKPDPRVYQYLAGRVGKTTSKEDMGSIWLVSGNPFDVVGARNMGMKAAWVDRGGGHQGRGGWTDRLGDLTSGGGPTVIVKSVEEAVDTIKNWSEDTRHNNKS